MATIDDILRESNALPSLPAIVLELQKCLDQDNTGTKLLAEKISYDQSLSAKTLRLANSPLYSMQCAVATIQQAVAVLGFESVRTMVTTAAIINAFVASKMPADFDFKDFWRHSLAVGMCAKALARYFDADPNQAFMAGLLHDIGKLVLARAYPAEFMETVRHAGASQCTDYAAEQALIGTDHAAVGAQLAKRWNFPPSIQKAIEEHETPDAPQEGNGLASVVHLADGVVISYGLAKQDAGEVTAPPFSSSVWEETKQSDEVLAWIAEETRIRLKEVCDGLLN